MTVALAFTVAVLLAAGYVIWWQRRQLRRQGEAATEQALAHEHTNRVLREALEATVIEVGQLVQDKDDLTALVDHLRAENARHLHLAVQDQAS